MRSLSLPRARTTGLAALLLIIVGFVMAQSAHAGIFPITESFRNTTVGTDWHITSPAHLTAGSDGEGNGWLRLTDAVNNQFGSVVDDAAFPSNNGILAEFEYSTHDGTMGSADGLVFFLYDGATTLGNFHAGPVGGSIGYTNCPSSSLPGLSGAYIGVAFDEYGNFSNNTFCNQNGGASDQLNPGRVAVRAGVDANYQYLTSAPVTGGLISTRTQARKIKVAITPDMKLSVYITQPDGTIQTVTSNYALPANAPSTLKMGFVAATGSQNNIHEIRSTQVVLPADLSTTVTDGATGSTRDAAHSWTSVVTNNGPNTVTGATIKATSDLPGISNVSWMCSATGGATCVDTTGTGLPDTTANLPTNGKVTYTILGDVASTADGTSLTVDAEQAAGGETGEMNPTDNVATDTTDLTPVWSGPTKPTFTLASGGTATSTGNGSTWLGTNLTYSRVWQRCDVDGSNCVDISSATGTTYATQAADQGHTLRLKVTATNAAGSDSATSNPFTGIPDTTITTHPAADVKVHSATFAFTQSGGAAGTTFQCSLDGGTFATCSATPTFSSVADGSHTLDVRAIYGGLPDPTPATYTWTVDTVAPTTTVLSGPPDETQSTTATLSFDGADETTAVDDLTYQCSLDGGSFTTCTSPVTFTGLAEGNHTLEVRAADGAGNVTPTATMYLWRVDTTPPDTAITIKPAALTNSTHAGFGHTSDESPVTYECSLDDAPFTPCPSSPFTGLADGDHTMAERATDAAGNVDPTPATWAWTVDTTIHGAITAPDDGAFLGDATPAIHLDGDASDTYTLSIDGSQAITGTFGASGATFTPSADLADGDHTFLLTVDDAASNETTDTITVHVDTAAPVAPTLDAGPPAATSDNSPVFTVTGENNGTLLCQLDGGAWEPCPSPLTYPDLDDGPHTVSFKTRDQAGNESAPTTSTFTVDRSTSLTVTGPQPGNIANAKPTVTAQGEPGATVSVEVDGVVVATGVVGPDGTVAITLPDALSEGDHTVRTTVTDAAGNAASGETHLHVDTQAPGTPAIPQGPAATSGSHDATFTFTGEEGSTFRCRLDGGAWIDCHPPMTLNDLRDGAHTLSIVATDASGNASPRQDYAWTVDTTPPAAPPAMTSPATKSTGNSAHFVFSLEPGSTLECAVDGGAFVPCNPDVDLTGLKDGHHTLVVRQIDAAGNAGAPARYEWMVVATAPKAHTARKLGAKIAARTTAADNRQVAVGCELDQANLSWCQVRAYHRDAKGHNVLVGTGRVKVAKAGHRSAVVQVTMNATGRRLLGGAVGGLAVRLAATGQGTGSKVLSAATRTVLYPQQLLVLPTINPFVFDSTQLINAASSRALHAIAAQIRTAKSVTCVGNTDAQGSDTYNKALGLRRAQTVCAALTHLGVKAHLNATSAGESHPRATNRTAAGRLANRRVELRVGY
jgi:outer membrane protein OmpA-like peptidoglycan-associated protein